MCMGIRRCWIIGEERRETAVVRPMIPAPRTTIGWGVDEGAGEGEEGMVGLVAWCV